jgi:methylated-DNA-[protein]-cysteine S-methyltransferase
MEVAKNTVSVHSFVTKIGKIRVGSTDNGLAVVELPGESMGQLEYLIAHHLPGYKIANGGPFNKEVERQLKAYAEGALKEFTLPLDLRGSSFQQKVLTTVARIPYGRTMTYGEVAKSIGSPGASRAVGHANARNLIPLVVPCHRVVASNGLGGYGGGLELKKRLLVMEGAL